ncbi:MAG TPA: LytR C-terminal domain-containing protein [Candidatus Saccharimonadales bacterium]|nr:LytR C-terminal domain-containing protein [Candidatus Saccharimonadales bacterium]
MARDFDFVRQRPNNQPAAPNQPVKPLPRSVVSLPRPGKKISVWIWVVIVFLLVAWVVFFYFLSLKPAAVSRNTAPTVSSGVASGGTAVLGAQTTNALTITLYNSGAGSLAVDALTQKLKTQGYTTQNSGDSQFQLDQTYIWYQPAYLNDVQKIQTLLGSKKVALRPYSGTGPYQILIQLGP